MTNQRKQAQQRVVTPKRRVLRRFPLAVCIPWMRGDRAYLIGKSSSCHVDELGCGSTPQKAWASACAALVKKGKPK